DPSGVQKVELLRDNVVFAALLTPPYTATIDTTTVADGVHLLTAQATDGVGLVATANIFVRVDNLPPTVTLTAPASGDVLRGNRAILTANASDANGIQKI